MKIGAQYSHLNGFEWIQYHQKSLWMEIEEVINAINADEYRTKISKEKTMKGKKLFSPVDLNGRIKVEFEHRAWFESRTSYWVTDDYKLITKTMHLKAEEQKAIIEESKRTPIYSYNQTDFVKNRIAVEVQFGKYSFIAYDLFVKHLAFYIGDTIDVGVEILPMKSMQVEMSSGPGYYESALYDLARQGRGVPAVPLVLVGIEP
ncbi:BglII/BstYI family type II restriction endonuclease [uncultured Eudoraea sp.]|uniref:BglII/BstYI family type II restriction endonuclease n=1 Tax=uncultured Eudoraea sp. TaxID=1035614 RepID=UPI002620DFCB|nr:BglII/BstYI family type II restriction endonuclease [uncultured Eudoraea sp.]